MQRANNEAYLQRKTRTRLPVAWFFAVILALACATPFAYGQAPTGAIQGVVTDTNGAVVAKAKVTVTDKIRGRTVSTTTTDSGTYVVSALIPGDYQVWVGAPGFKTGILGVAVEIGKATTGNVTLEPGALSEQVTVTAEAETAVDTNTNTVSGVISAKQIDALPLNGRSFLDLAQLQPGVQTIDGGTFDPTKNGFTGVSIAGGEGRTTRIQVDGLEVTDETVGTTVQNFSLDAVQEFQVSSSGMDPSTSLSNTGAIDIATRLGDNGFHGSGFIFWRDNRFAARVGNDPAPFNREQGGFRAGGPFIKDKLFWFVNYEKNRTQNSTILNAPSPFNVFNGFSPAPFRESEATGRVDWNAKDWAHIFFRFSHDFNQAITGFGGSNFSPFLNQDNTNSGVIGVDLTFSRFTHSFRIGRVNFANYINPASPPGIPNIPVEVQFLDTGVSVGPNLLAPQHTLQTDNELRYDGGLAYHNHSLHFGVEYNRINVNLFAAFFGNAPDVLTFSNSLTPGLPASDPLSYQPALIIFGNGLGFFSDKSNHGYKFGGVSNNRFAWYASDSWKARHNLTLNFGVRYEIDPGQVNNDLTRPAVLDTIAPGESRKVRLDKNNFAPNFGFAYDLRGKGTTVIRGGIGVYYESDIFNNVIFERASLLPNTIAPAFPAIQPGNPLVGPGGQLIFDFNSVAGRSIAQSLQTILGAQSQFQALSLAATSNFPNGVLSIIGGNGTQSTAGPIFASEFSQPYSIQTNIGVQHRFGQNWMVTADYVRNRGVHVFMTRDYNRVGAASTFNKAAAVTAIKNTLAAVAATCNCTINSIDDAIKAGATIADFANLGLGPFGAFPGNNPNFGQLTMIGTQGVSTYNGLLVKVNGKTNEFHHFLRSAQWGVSYALSRFESTAGSLGDQAFAQPALNNDCTLCGYGPNGVDRTHQFTINTSFEFPWGFRLSTISRWDSSLPVTLLLPPATAATQIFQEDIDGDGDRGGNIGTIGADMLPGTNIGAWGRSVSSVSQLNTLITNFNSEFAGHLTPAGQALLNSGLFTMKQLQELNAVVQAIPLAPAGQVLTDSFWTTDFRVSKVIKLKEYIRIEPSVDIFNVFNKANYDPPSGSNLQGTLSGYLSGLQGTVNGTVQGQRTNKLGLGAGSFSPGIPRAFQFGIRVSW